MNGDTFKLVLRAVPGLKGRAVLGSRMANLKLHAWVARAIERQCDREGVPTVEELDQRKREREQK